MNFKKKHTLVVFAFLFLLLSPVLSLAQIDLSFCDGDFVVQAPGQLIIDVSPTPNIDDNDTLNIQCALDAAVASGVPVVRLSVGSFFINNLFAENFRGSLQGTTRAGTRVFVRDGETDCAAMEANGFTPSIFKFSQGEPSLKTMQINVTSPCMSGDAISNVVHFTGRNANDPSCKNSVINARVDRVDILGPGRGQTVNVGIAASAEGGELDGCNVTLLGSLKVNFSSVTDVTLGVGTTMRASAQVDINNSDFINNGFSVLILDAFQSSTIIFNTFQGGQHEPGIMRSAGIVFGTSTADAPANNQGVIRSNTFDFQSPAGDVMDAILANSFEEGTQNVGLSVSQNTFNLSGTGIAGFFGLDINNATISDNLFNGAAFAAISLGVSEFPSVAGSTITANRGLLNYVGTPADVIINTGVNDTILGPNQNATFQDSGTNSVILSAGTVEKNTRLQSSSAGKSRDNFNMKLTGADRGFSGLVKLFNKSQ